MDTDELLGDEYEVETVDVPQHDGSGFCWDETCPDKEDQELIGALNQAVQDGLVSTDDANRIYHGRTF